MADKKRVGKWDGGFIYESTDKRRTYVIRRRINSKLYEVSTRCTSSTAATEQLRRFEANPENYEPGGTVRVDALFLDDTLVVAFLAWSRDRKKNTPGWVNNQSNQLIWWGKVLAGKDLRRLSLETDIVLPLDRAPGRPHKIEVIKALYAWLVLERRSLKPAEDPTFRTLKVPQATPEQWTRVKAFEPIEYQTIRRALEVGVPNSPYPCSFEGCGRARYCQGLCVPHYRQKQRGRELTPVHVPGSQWVDLLDILAATGWHVTELERFAARGTIVRIVGRGPVLESPLAKAGTPLRTEVSEEVASVAERVLKHGSFSRTRFDKAIKEARERTNTEVTAGTFRHSVATWAINAGSSPAEVSAFLNHKSERTTRRFYATHAVPTKIPTLK